MKIPVVFAFDESYALAASVAVKSLIESKLPTTEYEIFVLHNGVSRRTRDKFASIAPVQWVKVDDSVFRDWPRGWNRTTCYRLVMAEILRNLGKVIWSDCDVVFNSDLSSLFATDLDGCELAAILMETADERHGIHSHFHEGRPIFAAGCLVVDLELWRKEKFAARFAAEAAHFGSKLKMLDLDILNIACGNIKSLDIGYCVLERLITLGEDAPEYPWLARMHGGECLRKAVESPKIIHFAGPAVKVWLRRLGEMPEAYRELIIKSPFWDGDREPCGVLSNVRCFAKFLWHSICFVLTHKGEHRRSAGVYRRGLAK